MNVEEISANAAANGRRSGLTRVGAFPDTPAGNGSFHGNLGRKVKNISLVMALEPEAS